MAQFSITNNMQNKCDHQFNFYIAIDFGTDGVGLAYALGDNVYIHQKWNSTRYGVIVKPKSIILLDEKGKTKSFGLDAKMTYMITQSKRDKWMLFDRFKMSLYANKITDDEKKQVNIEDELIATNGKKYPSEKVFIAAFQHLQKETKVWIQKKQFKLKDNEIQWIITVPAIWNDEAKHKMKQWAIKSGLIDVNIPNQCKIVYEPDCASLSIQHHIHKDTNEEGKHNDNFIKGDKYILIDAGGGTVDIACHEILQQYGVKEILPPSGGKWGSCFIDDQYVKLLQNMFSKQWIDEFKQNEPNIYVEMIHNFQQAKAKFYSDPNADTHNVELPADFCGFLEDKLEEDSDEEYEDIDEKVNEMYIMGKSDMIEKDDEILEMNTFIWQSMFDYVITPTIKHVTKLLNEPRLMRRCFDYLCLVGGLSCSPYFQFKMRKEFGLKSKYNLKIIIPNKPILSVVEGAAYFGITKHYGIKRYDEKNDDESDMSSNWNFSEWLINNELTWIKQVFIDYSMNTLSSLTLSNTKFAALISDKRVVTNPSICAKIVQSMQSLDSVRNIIQKHDNNNQTKFIFVNNKETTQFMKIKKYIQHMKAIADEWKEIEIKYQKKQAKNTIFAANYIKKNISTLDMMKKRIIKLFDGYKQILLDKEKIVTNEINKYQQIFQEIREKDAESTNEMNLLLSKAQTQITDDEKYFKNQIVLCKDVMKQYANNDTDNEAIQNEDREKQISQIGVETQKYYENSVQQFGDRKRAIDEYIQNERVEQKVTYDIQPFDDRLICTDMIHSFISHADIDADIMLQKYYETFETKKIKPLMNENEKYKKTIEELTMKLNQLTNKKKKGITALNKQISKQNQTIIGIKEKLSKRKAELQELQKSLCKNRLKNVIKQKDFEIKQLKKEQVDSSMLLKTIENVNEKHKYLQQQLKKEQVDSTILVQSIQNVNEKHKDLQQQFKKEQVDSAMLVEDVQYLNEENKDLQRQLSQQMKQNEAKSNFDTINDTDNATFIHFFNKQYINKKKWKFCNNNKTLTAVSKDWNDDKYYSVYLFDHNKTNNMNKAISKRKICGEWVTYGYCYRGDECNLVHDEEEMDVKHIKRGIVYCSIKWTKGKRANRAPCCIGIVSHIRNELAQYGMDEHKWLNYFDGWNHAPYWYLNQTITVKLDFNRGFVSYFKGDELFKMDSLPKNSNWPCYLMLCGSVHPEHACGYAIVRSERL